MLDTTPAAPGLPQLAVPYKKKLIEVAMPLQAINKASRNEINSCDTSTITGSHNTRCASPAGSFVCRKIRASGYHGHELPGFIHRQSAT